GANLDIHEAAAVLVLRPRGHGCLGSLGAFVLRRLQPGRVQRSRRPTGALRVDHHTAFDTAHSCSSFGTMNADTSTAGFSSPPSPGNKRAEGFGTTCAAVAIALVIALTSISWTLIPGRTAPKAS